MTGSTAPRQVQEALDAFRHLLTVPSVTRATFVPASQDIVIETSNRSLTTLSKRTATRTFRLPQRPDEPIVITPLTLQDSSIKHTAFSPNGKLQAVFRDAPAKQPGGQNKRIVEVWDVESGALLHDLDVTTRHGEWYFDSTFGPASWHESDGAIVYVADASKSKATDLRNSSLPDAESFKYVPDYGETFTGKRNPCIFLLVLPGSYHAERVSDAHHLERDSRAMATGDGKQPLAPDITRTDAPSPSQIGNEMMPAEKQPSTPSMMLYQLTSQETFPTTDFGQPVFTRDDDSGCSRLLTTGYSRLGDARKLGIVYCQNRPSAIYLLSLKVEKTVVDDKKVENAWTVHDTQVLTTADRSARSPRAWFPTVEDDILGVFLSNEAGGPHGSCTSLHVIRQHRTEVIVDVVHRAISLDEFPGLYIDQLPQECFVCFREGPTILTSSIWGSRKVPLAIDVQSGKVTSLAPWPKGDKDEVEVPFLHQYRGLDSFVVMGTDGWDKVVALRSGCTYLPIIVVGDLRNDRESVSVEWEVVHQIRATPEIEEALSKLSYTVLPLPNHGRSEIILVSPVEIDLHAPTGTNLPPLLTMPHGGPHSTLTTEWSVGVAAYALAGYRVALVNYPGSLGYGQDFVKVLPPQLGRLEVEATLAAGQHLATLSLASRTRGKKLIAGGSHGGFISAHLTARYPDEYDACLMRNPVTDLMGELQSTDIPDWVIAETDREYSFDRPTTVVTPELYKHLYDASPLTYVSNVKTSTMLMIGLSDRRVPPDQGRAWYHSLKALKNVRVEMMSFPDNGHALDDMTSRESVAAWRHGHDLPASMSTRNVNTVLSPITPPPVARSQSPTKRPVSMLADLSAHAQPLDQSKGLTMLQQQQRKAGTSSHRPTSSLSSLNLRELSSFTHAPSSAIQSPYASPLSRSASVLSGITTASSFTPTGAMHEYKHRTAVGAVHEDMQNKVFCKWLNARLVPRYEPVTDLGKDFQDGTRLIQLVEVLTEQSLGRYNREPHHRVQKFENARHALERIKEMGVHLTNIGPEDIVDGNRKLILGMIWSLVLRFSIADIEEEGTHAKEGLLLWCQRRTEPYNEVDVQNFSKSFQDGLAFCALIHRHRPDLIDWDALSKDARDAEANVQLAFKIADKHLGIPQLLEVSDIVGRRPDEKSIMTYVAQYFHAFSSRAQNETDARVITSFVDNVSSLMLALHDYERRVELFLAFVDRQSQQWLRPLSVESYLQLKQTLDDVDEYRSTVKREMGAERIAVQDLLLNIRTKLKTYGLRDYVPEDSLSTNSLVGKTVERAWEGLLGREMKHVNDVRQAIRRLRDKAAEHYAHKANDLYDEVRDVDAQLTDLGGPLDVQATRVAQIAQVQLKLNRMLQDVKSADEYCRACQVEYNPFSVHELRDLEELIGRVVKRCRERALFIENQMVARKKSDVSPRDLEEFDSAFRSFDKDGLGSLTVDQLAGALGALGVLEIDLEEIHAQVGDTVSYEEFIQFMVSRKETRPTSDKVQQCFRSAANGKPYITELDLRKLDLPATTMNFLLDKLELYVPPVQGDVDPHQQDRVQLVEPPMEQDGDAFDYITFVESFSE
ncbi:alpha-actinin [Microbotryomycetes sp. JL201]|nr:alpha-actinin [Microbotryomycetes sp. JL201]